MNPFVNAIAALNQSGNRYIIVGGFAVVMHGINRFTPDLNVITDLKEDGMRRMLDELLAADLKTDLTDDPYEFLDKSKRDEWHFKKNLWFLSFKDPQGPTFSMDLFLTHPFEFEQLYRDSERICVHGHSTHICSLDHLIELKQLADRGQDRIDIENLRIVKSLLPIINDPARCEEVISASEKGFERSRILDLIEFGRLSPDERLNWVIAMLTQLGRFCVLE